jgi:hypothetical protein
VLRAEASDLFEVDAAAGSAAAETNRKARTTEVVFIAVLLDREPQDRADAVRSPVKLRTAR